MTSLAFVPSLAGTWYTAAGLPLLGGTAALLQMGSFLPAFLRAIRGNYESHFGDTRLKNLLSLWFSMKIDYIRLFFARR